MKFCINLLIMIFLTSAPALAKPPYAGTIFVNGNIITSSDPSTLLSVKYRGQKIASMYDRREIKYIENNAYQFTAEFQKGFTARIRVNSEFGSVVAAETEAQKYATELGRLPDFLLTEVETISIHKGRQAFGGGNKDVLIHTGKTVEYERTGILEETLFHEAVHTSIDPKYSYDAAWKRAQADDDNFISTYAEEFPDREDLAESMLLAYAAYSRPNRLSRSEFDIIRQTIPNRIRFFANTFNFTRQARRN